MPRFNFSSYYTKDSLTCLNSNHGLNPQEDWENAHKDGGTSGGEAEGSNPMVVSSSELERSLAFEFDELAQHVEMTPPPKQYTKSKSYAQSPMIASKGQPEVICNRIGCASSSGVEKCRCVTDDSGISDHGPSVVFNDTVCSDDTYQSSPRTSTPIRDVGKKESPNASSPTKCPATQGQGNTKRKFRKGLVMVLDDLDTLTQVNHLADLDTVLPLSEDAEQGLSPHVKNALSRLQSLPIDKINHFSGIGEYLKHLRESHKICDVEIHIESEQFLAHRAVLACFSEYFSHLFFKDSDKQKVPLIIRLRGVTSRSFHVFLEWVYTGELHITPLLVADLLVIAQHLQVPALEDKCAEFLQTMPLDKSIAVLQSGRVVTSSDLYDVCVSHVSTQFPDAIEQQSFILLDVHTLCMILSRDDLNITSEIEVFRVGLKWIAYDMHQRHKHLAKVMSCVRFPYMTHAELFECFEVTDLLRECPETRNAILHANWVATSWTLGRDDPLNIPVIHPRIALSKAPNLQAKKASSVYLSSHSMRSVKLEMEPATKPCIDPDNAHISKTGDIIAIGGFQKFTKARDNRTVKTVERYNSVKNQWTHYTNLPQPRFHHGTATLNKRMYVIGGSDPAKSTKTSVPTSDAFVYGLDTDEWKQISSMLTPRMHHAVCSLFGMVYAIGGQDENARVLSSVECYNPLTDSWCYVKPMMFARLGVAAAVQDGKIVVVGGYGEAVNSKSGLPVLATVEVYDPRENSWTKKNDLRIPRCYGNLVSVCGELFLCGGATRSFTTDNSVLTSIAAIDVYNKWGDAWEHKANMVIARHFTGSAVIGGKIYIIGGVSTEAGRILQSIECYDVVNDVWVNGVQELPYPARWLSCIALPGQI